MSRGNLSAFSSKAEQNTFQNTRSQSSPDEVDYERILLVAYGCYQAIHLMKSTASVPFSPLVGRHQETGDIAFLGLSLSVNVSLPYFRYSALITRMSRNVRSIGLHTPIPETSIV